MLFMRQILCCFVLALFGVAQSVYFGEPNTLELPLALAQKNAFSWSFDGGGGLGRA